MDFRSSIALSEGEALPQPIVVAYHKGFSKPRPRGVELDGRQLATMASPALSHQLEQELRYVRYT